MHLHVVTNKLRTFRLCFEEENVSTGLGQTEDMFMPYGLRNQQDERKRLVIRRKVDSQRA